MRNKCLVAVNTKIAIMRNLTRLRMLTGLQHVLFLFLLASTLHGLAQQHEKQISVKGVITNQKGEPLPAVSIIVKGSSKGATTEADGSFQITASRYF